MAVAPQPRARKVPTCKRLFKNDDLELVECNLRLGPAPDYRCENRHRHVSKYKTGWCAHSQCEGSNPVTFRGDPAPTCKMWQTCPCDCHRVYDMMFHASDMPRETVDNSHWHPPKGEFWMPTPEERMALIASSKPHAPDAPVLVESPLPEAVPATIRHTFAPTATGRAARGELESWVKEQCDIWLVEKEEFPCATKYLSDEIGRAQGIKPPSVGAISAVFDRWTAIGFATIEKKPTRFVAYTQEGITLGLEGCKDKHKRSRRSLQAASARTLR
jgi:hypothetical protein